MYIHPYRICQTRLCSLMSRQATEIQREDCREHPRLRGSPNYGNQVQNSAAESDGSQERRDKAAAVEAYHAAQRGLPLLIEPLGCDQRRPILPMKREWRNCSQVIPSWDTPVLIDRITPSNKRALRCASESCGAVVQGFLPLPDICRLETINVCCRAHRYEGAGTVAISDLAINQSALIVRCDPARPRVA
jgi:hypothetical protein